MHNSKYDKNNIFKKIISKTVPANIVLEDENCMAFHDINPQAKTHVIIIPKGEFADFEDFVLCGNLSTFMHFVVKVAEKLQVTDYRLMTNKGALAGQSVFHFHMHLLAGNLSEAKLV
jgi:diadenosine tetraphosphate (Ap4A) HIT family hydrolase